MQFTSLKVVAVNMETEDTVTISFKQPALKKVRYVPGQYLTLIFRINGRRFIRPYSFSSAPLFDDNLDITVKRVPGGVVSNHIIDKVKVNDIIEVMPPMGDFILDEATLKPTTHIVLWGAGSGITPLMSIAKYALRKKLGEHVTLIYGNRNTESVIFSKTIKHLEDEYSNTFRAWHFHTQAAVSLNNPYHVQGRIDPLYVLNVIAQEGDLNRTLHYICGPAGLKESVKVSLEGLGVDKSKIYSEDFEIVRDPTQFQDVITRTISLKKDGNVYAIEVAKGKSILESGLDAFIDMPYSCQTGNCCVCKGKLIRGEVKLIGGEKESAKLEVDERLLCCSFPLTDNIEIEVE
ncbi:FAD-binding oxidoreductase [Mucilaginibacter gilvus]|uniref:2Fe-2S iron-sulfur cluster binding domain-containing protein n=1 Tax=Mucilaginibacter gilvus TaxID=2305909 RepID=A0A444MLK8_9SPHI|nr:FAD-binding oxidoreductase [Mucilaginibacter gilvus]RWY50187.1 2Fe-2S iron-sulfur cluster binding domain-containing protein [Mucilaginibacter gilvus]